MISESHKLTEISLLSKAILTVIICLLCSFTTTVNAQERAPYLFVGTTFPYILEQSMDGSPRGLSVDILNRISELTGDQFEILVLPWPRALRLVEMGHADGLIGPYKTEQREKILDYSVSEIYRDHMMFLAKTGRFHARQEWSGDFDDIKEKQVITIRGWAYGDRFDKARSQLKVIEANTFAHGLQMLQKNRGDLLAANERNALFEIRKENLQSEVSFLKRPFGMMVGYFGFSKKKADHHFQARFNESLNQLHLSNEMHGLWKQYGLTLYPKAGLDIVAVE